MTRREVSENASALEWWAAATLALAAILVLALTQPAVGRPPPGFPTFMALSLTVLACALEAAAIARRPLAGRPGWLRASVAVASFLAMLAAGGWLIGRAPGLEVLLAWLLTPPALGIGAVLVAGRRGSWAAVAFLALAGLLVAALGPRWVLRV